jgi:hypothetical protein
MDYEFYYEVTFSKSGTEGEVYSVSEWLVDNEYRPRDGDVLYYYILTNTRIGAMHKQLQAMSGYLNNIRRLN